MIYNELQFCSSGHGGGGGGCGPGGCGGGGGPSISIIEVVPIKSKPVYGGGGGGGGHYGGGGTVLTFQNYLDFKIYFEEINTGYCCIHKLTS